MTDATSQSYPSGIQSGPLYCPSPVRDVGTIWAGDRLTTTYEVFNIGDTPVAVRITPVYTGTAAAHDPILIAPGRTLIIDVNRKSPDTLHGVFTTAYVVHVIDE
ncbi:MAG: hypothetical protein FLDDKLPJ_03162 [Phycisphaerae bacterium]|nr:hypothetical protein [Phycisphaerae bacterium]